MRPVIELHDGIHVVRDDLLPGGTKSRFLAPMYADTDELVYASPAEGGMQVALAHTARRLGKRATIFVAARRQLHERTREAFRAGAMLQTVRPGYLAVVQARAREYAAERPWAQLVEFGGYSELAVQVIAEAAREAVDALGYTPHEVWCAAGSGTLTRGLQAGIPSAEHFAVRVGRSIEDAGDAFVIPSAYRFEQRAKEMPPFPSCPHYDAKAWEIARRAAEGGALFWNVLGPSPTWAAEPLA